MVSKEQISLLREKQSHFFSENEYVKKWSAKDAMIKPVLLYSEDSVEKILKKLKKEHVNTCIVITKDRKFVGEISENDIIKLFLQQVRYEPLVKELNRGYRREFLHKKAVDMINKHTSYVESSTPINDVIKLIWKEGFEYIPVLNKNKKVVGVITPSSIINLLKDY